MVIVVVSRGRAGRRGAIKEGTTLNPTRFFLRRTNRCKSWPCRPSVIPSYRECPPNNKRRLRNTTEGLETIKTPRRSQERRNLLRKSNQKLLEQEASTCTIHIFHVFLQHQASWKTRNITEHGVANLMGHNVVFGACRSDCRSAATRRKSTEIPSAETGRRCSSWKSQLLSDEDPVEGNCHKFKLVWYHVHVGRLP